MSYNLSSHRLNLFNHSSITGRLDFFPYIYIFPCAIINNTWRYGFILIVDYFLGVNSQEQDFWVKGHKHFFGSRWLLLHCRPGGLYRFTEPPAAQEGTSFFSNLACIRYCHFHKVWLSAASLFHWNFFSYSKVECGFITVF